LLLPGHVAAVTGADYFAFVPKELGLPSVVAGFEPIDIMTALLALTKQAAAGESRLQNAYPRAVRPEPNKTAWAVIEQVFVPTNAVWRGLGEIAASGLSLRQAYAGFDALTRFNPPVTKVKENPACRCGEVLRGELNPKDCPLFAHVCNLDNPQGPCMVSFEGACGIAINNEQ
jgi:hydrogenase expression/formation protein HypD